MSWYARIVPVAVAACAIAACSSSATTTEPQRLPYPRRALHAHAIAYTRGHGDAHPTNIVVVRTTLGRAFRATELAPGAAPHADDPDTPVWLFQATGHFTPNDPPTGGVVMWVANVNGGEIRFAGSGFAKPIRLGRLGHVADIT